VSDKLITEGEALAKFREAIRKMLSRPVERLEPEIGPERCAKVQGR
jgi:hypothetical protein